MKYQSKHYDFCLTQLIKYVKIRHCRIAPNTKETLINTFQPFFKMYSKTETRTFFKTAKRTLRFNQLFPNIKSTYRQILGYNNPILRQAPLTGDSLPAVALQGKQVYLTWIILSVGFVYRTI
ncbi:MAG: hypothetical protein ACI4JK_08855 [Oscillospiraceae bacterium]